MQYFCEVVTKVRCLDNPFVPQELERAYTSFLERRMIDQGHDDIITVVQFDSTARVICQASPIHDAPKSLTMRGGGTCFAGAMAQAQNILNRYNASSPARLVFMSDGGASDANEAALTMASILNGNPKVGVEVIAFGGGADMAALGAIAMAGRTVVTSAVTGGLTKIFVDIARGASKPSEELYVEICKRITEEVSTQLMLEYL